jgi:predicted transposase YbfD/YdcC
MEYTEPNPAPATQAPSFQVSFDELQAAFNSLPDPRKNHNKCYSMSSLLLALTAALLCNHLSVLACAEWLADQTLAVKLALGFVEGKTPHQSTFQRAFQKLKASTLETALTRYFEARRPHQIRARGSQSVAFDGKSQRGRLPFEEEVGTPCHLLSAFCQELGLVLAQVAIKNKEAELTMAPQLLKQLDWTGRVLTGDALFCQRKLCEAVVEFGGDYLFVVKSNQATLEDDITLLFEEATPQELARQDWAAPIPLEMAQAKQLDKGHGRIEIRQIKVSSELKGYSDWPYLAQVFQLKREWYADNHWHSEIQLGITSLPKEVADPLRLLEIRRGHWGIENRLHWVKDNVLAEDKSTIHKAEGPQVVGAIRNTALNLLRQAGHIQISRQLRHNSRNPHSALALMGLILPSA